MNQFSIELETIFFKFFYIISLRWVMVAKAKYITFRSINRNYSKCRTVL